MSEAVEPGLQLLDRQNRFVSDNMRRIFIQIYRIVGNVADAQDLTQETFIKALQHQEQRKDELKAAHWLSRIVTCRSASRQWRKNWPIRYRYSG